MWGQKKIVGFTNVFVGDWFFKKGFMHAKNEKICVGKHS